MCLLFVIHVIYFGRNIFIIGLNQSSEEERIAKYILNGLRVIDKDAHFGELQGLRW